MLLEGVETILDSGSRNSEAARCVPSGDRPAQLSKEPCAWRRAELGPTRAVVVVPAISAFWNKQDGTALFPRITEVPYMMLLRIGVFLGVHAGILLGVLVFL